MDEKKGKQSTFNAGALSVMRLNDVMRQANFYSMEGDLPKWYNALQVLWREATSKMNKRERENSIEWQKRIPPVSQEYKRFSRSTDPQIRDNTFDSLYRALQDYEVWIRGVMDNHGMMMPDADDPGTASEDMGKDG